MHTYMHAHIQSPNRHAAQHHLDGGGRDGRQGPCARAAGYILKHHAAVGVKSRAHVGEDDIGLANTQLRAYS
jgi:hypothetical protein